MLTRPSGFQADQADVFRRHPSRPVGLVQAEVGCSSCVDAALGTAATVCSNEARCVETRLISAASARATLRRRPREARAARWRCTSHLERAIPLVAVCAEPSNFRQRSASRRPCLHASDAPGTSASTERRAGSAASPCGRSCERSRTSWTATIGPLGRAMGVVPLSGATLFATTWHAQSWSSLSTPAGVARLLGPALGAVCSLQRATCGKASR